MDWEGIDDGLNKHKKHKNWTAKVKMENFINLEESREI